MHCRHISVGDSGFSCMQHMHSWSTTYCNLPAFFKGLSKLKVAGYIMSHLFCSLMQGQHDEDDWQHQYSSQAADLCHIRGGLGAEGPC